MVNFNSVSALTISAVLSTSLILGGCGDKNKKNSKSDMIEVKSRTVSDAEAEKALKAMSLFESGSGELTWSSRTGSGGNYVFTDVTTGEDDDKTAKNIAKMEIKGAHMEGEIAAFDQIKFKDISSIDDGVTTSFGEIALSNPSPALANAVAAAIQGDEDAFENLDGEFSFTGFDMVDMDISSDDSNMKLARISFAEAKDETAVITIENFDMQTLDATENMKMSLESFTVEGLNLNKYKDLFVHTARDAQGSATDTEAFQALMKSINPYDPDFSNMSMENFNVDVNGLIMNLDSYTGNVVKKDGKILSTIKMTPLTITPPAETTDPELMRFTEGLNTMGYDKLSLMMGGTTILDEANDRITSEDMYIELQDGFKTDYFMDITGYKAFNEKLNAAVLANPESPNTMSSLEAISQLKVNKFSLDFHDNSIVDRAFKLAAKQQGTSVDALKQQAKMSVGFLGMMAKDEAQQKLATEFGAALTALIDNSGTLSIKVEPEEEFALIFLGSNGQYNEIDLEKLNVSVSHQE